MPNSNTNSLEAGVVLSELCWLLAAGCWPAGSPAGWVNVKSSEEGGEAEG